MGKSIMTKGADRTNEPTSAHELMVRLREQMLAVDAENEDSKEGLAVALSMMALERLDQYLALPPLEDRIYKLLYDGINPLVHALLDSRDCSATAKKLLREGPIPILKKLYKFDSIDPPKRAVEEPTNEADLSDEDAQRAALEIAETQDKLLSAAMDSGETGDLGWRVLNKAMSLLEAAIKILKSGPLNYDSAGETANVWYDIEAQVRACAAMEGQTGRGVILAQQLSGIETAADLLTNRIWPDGPECVEESSAAVTADRTDRLPLRSDLAGFALGQSEALARLALREIDDNWRPEFAGLNAILTRIKQLNFLASNMATTDDMPYGQAYSIVFGAPAPKEADSMQKAEA